jgi:hypothetical protein
MHAAIDIIKRITGVRLKVSLTISYIDAWLNNFLLLMISAPLLCLVAHLKLHKSITGADVESIIWTFQLFLDAAIIAIGSLQIIRSWLTITVILKKD